MPASLLTLLFLQAAGSSDCTIEVTVAAALTGERQSFCIRYARDGRLGSYRLDHRRTRRTGQPQNLRITSLQCPRLAEHIAGLEQLRTPIVDVPGAGREATSFIMDGAGYTLRAPALWSDGQSGRLELRSNVGSPLAVWTQTLRTIALGCASSRAPR